MIASVRGLAVLAAIAILLGIAALVGPAEHARIDRSLAPGLAADAVTSITVTHVGAPPVQLVREPDGWYWTTDRALAETSTVGAILSTLRGAHWHRHAGASIAQPVTAELRLVGGKALALSRGRDVPGAAQTWILRGSDAFLVDSWVATALFPTPLALRVAHPMANASQAKAIIAGSLRIEGTHAVAPSSVWLDPVAVARLTTALASLEIVALPPGTPGMPTATDSLGSPVSPASSPASSPAPSSSDSPGSPGTPAAPDATIAIEVDGTTSASIARVGTCPDGRVLVRATTGGGCVEPSAWQAIVDALVPLRTMGDDVVDLHPLPIEPTQITFGDGTVLSLASPPRIGDGDADRQRVEELVAALSAAGTRTPRPAGAPRTTLVARDAAGTEVVLEVFDKAIARRGESIAIAPAPEALAVIGRPPGALRDPVRWREDATTLSSLTVNGTTYTRGAVLGEWTRTLGGSGSPGWAGSAASASVSVDDAALVDALASALAIVRARDETSTAPMPLSIRVTFTPPAGAPRTHELALGAPTQDGCPARIDGASVRADLALCTAAHALAN